ncbi:CAF17-like 4Fe-4S cluster assembly/insertion protein YgfZ [Pseudomonas turukhanskensis]|uniref:tRNA-modifying protein YgfZ n=1 Tax=Pseudomonas turukhanskensis TaxID=1806536 RepID=A0A9W6K637_9PSED|nr:folate-binding protein YgfZ [Pseudomonas turukhanskensis]GLK88174.1 tRNA-modifying protein YgfZ [Pseudomonas turukhanskensis]
MADSAFFCMLSHEGVIAVRGPDASKFLQGQVTCNLNYLSDSNASLGARCTPKGRMVSSFRIVSEGDGYLLALAGDLLEAQLTDLKKYAVFSKSTLSDESAEWLRLGLVDADEVLGELGLMLPTDADGVARTENLLAIRLPDGRVELWVRQAIRAEVLQQIQAKLPERPLNTWLLAQIRAGIGQVLGPTRELFIPQMINLQAVGGVSFKKGCYTGQEIVARMQYLGKLKRRLQRLSLEGSELPAVASELFSPVHRSSVGEVVLAAQSETGVELLAVLQEDAVTDGRIHLGSETGPALQLLDLPYTLNADREIQR